MEEVIATLMIVTLTMAAVAVSEYRRRMTLKSDYEHLHQTMQARLESLQSEIARYEKIRDELASAVGHDMTDRELAGVARKLVAKAVERYAATSG